MEYAAFWQLKFLFTTPLVIYISIRWLVVLRQFLPSKERILSHMIAPKVATKAKRWCSTIITINFHPPNMVVCWPRSSYNNPSRSAHSWGDIVMKRWKLFTVSVYRFGPDLCTSSSSVTDFLCFPKCLSSVSWLGAWTCCSQSNGDIWAEE